MHQTNEELGIAAVHSRERGRGQGQRQGQRQGQDLQGQKQEGALLGIHNPMLPLGRFYIRRRFITCVYYPQAVHEQFTSILISLQYMCGGETEHDVVAIRPSVSVVVNVLAIRFRHRESRLRVLPLGLAMPALQCEWHMFSVRSVWREMS
jgi:hypothetical protein